MKIIVNVQKLTIMIFALCLTTGNLDAMIFKEIIRRLMPPWCFDTPTWNDPESDHEKACDKLMYAVSCNQTDKALAIIAELDRRGKGTEIFSLSHNVQFWRSRGGILVVATEKRNTILMQELLREDRPLALRQRMLCAPGSLGETALIKAIDNNDTEAVHIIIQAAQSCECLDRVLTAVDLDDQTPLLLAIDLDCNLEIITTLAQAQNLIVTGEPTDPVTGALV